MGNREYSMAFTTGGLFTQESVKIAKLYLEMGDWNKVRDEVLNGNLLQSRTSSTAKRVCREIIQRLKPLEKEELEFLIDTNSRNQRYLLWIAACRRYRFIREFAIEVLHERYIALKNELNYEEFDSFLNRKAELNQQFEEIRQTTRKKLRQVLFKMLREADLLDKDNEIKAAFLDKPFMDALSGKRREEVALFPVFDDSFRRSVL